MVQQVETAQFFAEPARSLLTGQLVCYGRTVAGPEWRALEAGTLEQHINPWAGRMFQTLKQVEPKTGPEQSAYDTWTGQTQQRELARNARIHGAPGLIPAPMWVVLYLLAAVLFTYMLFFADSAERRATQVLLMASVTVVVVTSLLLLNFFNHPFGTGVGTLKPISMERALHFIDSDMASVGVHVTPPCTARSATPADPIQDAGPATHSGAETADLIAVSSSAVTPAGCITAFQASTYSAVYLCP